MSAKIEVEDIEPCGREMIGKAACRKVPRVAVLPEAMDEEDRRDRPAAVVRQAFADHRQRDLASTDDELLHERRSFVPIDGLFEGTAVEDQAAGAIVR